MLDQLAQELTGVVPADASALKTPVPSDLGKLRVPQVALPAVEEEEIERLAGVINRLFAFLRRCPNRN